MSETKMRARVVRVEHHQGKSGWFFAKSPDLRGLLVSEPTLEALERAVPQAIIDLYAACGVEVIVERLDEDFDHAPGWIAISAQVAARALEERSH